MACLRLVTLPPLPLLPERRVPCFSRRIALSTDLLAASPYFLPPDFFFAAIRASRCLKKLRNLAVPSMLQARDKFGEKLLLGERLCRLTRPDKFCQHTRPRSPKCLTRLVIVVIARPGSVIARPGSVVRKSGAMRLYRLDGKFDEVIEERSAEAHPAFVHLDSIHRRRVKAV